MADADKLQNIWNVDTQVSLFHAMQDHKPVGMPNWFRFQIKFKTKILQMIFMVFFDKN